MRCPKCGYISFDHLTSCKQCQKDFSAEAITVTGGAFSAVSPSFLQVNASDDASPAENGDLTEDAVDSELDILLTDEPDDDIFTLDDEDEEVDFDFLLPEEPGEVSTGETPAEPPSTEDGGDGKIDDEFHLLLDTEDFLRMGRMALIRAWIAPLPMG